MWRALRALLTAFGLSAALVGAACVNVRQAPPNVPTIVRPMTDGIRGFAVPLSFWQAAAVATFNALPNEGAVCFLGSLAAGDAYVRDMSFVRAQVVAADSTSVSYNCPDTPDVIGFGHSHPLPAGEMSCRHSQPTDVQTLEHSPYIFSAVFCTNGLMELQTQDGRHVVIPWHPPTTPTLPGS